MKRAMLKVVALALVLGGVGQVKAGVIDIPTDGTEISYWGPSSSFNQSYGQIFTVPGGSTVLNDYTLTVRYFDTSFPFVSQLYAWNGTTTTGPALFTSGTLNTAPTETPYTFTPNVGVTAGQQYIAFVTNQPNGASLGGSGYGDMAGTYGSYSGGQFEYAGGNPQGGSWSPSAVPNAEFHADFSGAAAVPEPASLTLLGIGAISAIGYAWRRRKPTA